MGSRELVVNPIINPHVRSALDRARDLPSVPAVALEVMRVARTQEADAAALAQIVSLDPALAAKILKTANSGLLGPRIEIRTLKRACTHLGFKTVTLWALSFVVVDSLLQPRPAGFDYHDYWKRSVFRAVSAKLIAEAVRPKLADEAFLAGLLSQVGQLVLAFCLPDEFQSARKAAGGLWPSQQVQQRTLGFTTDELGVALLNAWGLPDVIHQSVLNSQAPDQSAEGPSDNRDIAQVLIVANHCETLFTYGLMAEPIANPDQLAGSGMSNALVDLYESAHKYFGLDEARLEQVLSKLDRRTEEIAEILHVNLGERLDSAAILREAQNQILRETVTLLRDALVSEHSTEQVEFLKLSDAVRGKGRSLLVGEGRRNNLPD